MCETNMYSKGMQSKRGGCDSTDNWQPLPGDWGTQKTRVHTAILIMLVLRNVLPLLIFHKMILPDSAVLSRGRLYFLPSMETINNKHHKQ